MNCDEALELLPAYALGALESDELQALEAHLRDCREHDAELTDLRATVFALDRHGSAGVPAPSEDLGTRIRAMVGPSRSMKPTAVASRSATLPFSPVWGAIAASLLLLAAFVAGWMTSRTLDDSGEAFAYQLQGADGQVLEVAGVAQEGSVTVTMANIDPVPDGSAYQLWAVREGGWISIGTCNTNENGWWRGDFAFSFERGEEIALTVEPYGGSERPSGNTVLRGEF